MPHSPEPDRAVRRTVAKTTPLTTRTVPSKALAKGDLKERLKLANGKGGVNVRLWVFPG
ncbi:hypothetical protein C8J41_10869 [Sphingomonas sp. PP-CC-3G-468]|nr:hypothetical protein C8J41_10869 [Sphingomonas sp. PP-CC-3G-468]